MTASYTDLILNIDTDVRLHTKIYELISHFLTVAYHLLIYKSVLLTQKLLQQGYEKERMKMTRTKLYEHHHEYVDLCDESVSKLTYEVLPSLRMWFTVYIVWSTKY